MGSAEYTTSTLPPNAFTSPFFSYDTSYIRHDHGVIPEGGNQCGEQHHENPPSVSLGSTPISCVKGDEDFVRSGGEYHRCRLLFLWKVVYGCINQYDLALRTWLKLLEGSMDDNVWLWVDGDDEKVEVQSHEPTPTDWDKALSALSRRLKRIEKEESVQLKERRRRVQEADLKTRRSMIAWLVVSSETMRVTDASRGYRRRDIWDLGGLIYDWYYSQATYHDLVTPNDSNDSNVFPAFCDVMTTHGHACHRACDDDDDDESNIVDNRRLKKWIRKWIWIRSILNPSQCYDVEYFSLEENSQCRPCTAQLARMLSRSSASNSNLGFQYRPPHHLVFLWVLWVGGTGGRRFSEWLKCLKRMACQEASPLLKVSTLKSVDNWLDTYPLKTTRRREKFVPWVNFYPYSWRYLCTWISSCDWQQAETSIRAMTEETELSCSFDIHDSPTSVNIRTWIGAVLLLSSKGSKNNSNADFSNNPTDFRSMVNNYRVEDVLKSIPATPEVEPTAAVINFRRATKAAQQSHHTCYKRFSRALLDWYASAVSMITGTDHIKFVPLTGDKFCHPCKIPRCLRDLVMGGKLSSPIERQQNLNSIYRELASIMAQEGLQLELPTGDSRLGTSLSPNEGNSVAGLNGGSAIGTSDMIHSSNRTENSPHDQQDNTEALDSETLRRDGGTVLTPPQRPKRFLMIKEIKLHFIKLLEDLGVPIPGVKAKQLPWTTLCTLLIECGWELDNWPTSVPLPGSGDQSCDDNKGINGLDVKHLHLLYDAMKSETCPLGFRKIVDTTVPAAVVGGSQVSDRSTIPAGNNSDVIHESTIAQPDTSRRRPRDSQDADGIETHPEKRPRISERTVGRTTPQRDTMWMINCCPSWLLLSMLFTIA